MAPKVLRRPAASRPQTLRRPAASRPQTLRRPAAATPQQTGGVQQQLQEEVAESTPTTFSVVGDTVPRNRRIRAVYVSQNSGKWPAKFWCVDDDTLLKVDWDSSNVLHDILRPLHEFEGVVPIWCFDVAPVTFTSTEVASDVDAGGVDELDADADVELISRMVPEGFMTKGELQARCARKSFPLGNIGD